MRGSGSEAEIQILRETSCTLATRWCDSFMKITFVFLRRSLWASGPLGLWLLWLWLWSHIYLGKSFFGSLFGTLFVNPCSDRCPERCSDPVSASPVFLMTVSWAQSSNPQSSEPQSSESQSSELRASELRALFNVVRKLIRCSDRCLTLFEALFVVVRAWLWPFPLFEENINNCEPENKYHQKQDK